MKNRKKNKQKLSMQVVDKLDQRMHEACFTTKNKEVNNKQQKLTKNKKGNTK